MKNEIMKFINEEFGEIRAITRDGEPWFVAKDIAKTLGYSKLDNMYKNIHKNDKMTINPRDIDTTGFEAYIENAENATTVGNTGFLSERGIQQLQWLQDFNPNTKRLTIINESGLYTAIFGSKTKSADEFKYWITHDVLPSIRKHGAYITDEFIERLQTEPDYLAYIKSIVTRHEYESNIVTRKAMNCDEQYKDWNRNVVSSMISEIKAAKGVTDGQIFNYVYNGMRKSGDGDPFMIHNEFIELQKDKAAELGYEIDDKDFNLPVLYVMYLSDTMRAKFISHLGNMLEDSAVKCA